VRCREKGAFLGCSLEQREAEGVGQGEGCLLGVLPRAEGGRGSGMQGACSVPPVGRIGVP
jgi:hypothetical protein